MNTLRTVIATLGLLSSAALFGCGGSSCEQLKAKCDSCNGVAGRAAGKAACNSLVTQRDEALCKSALDAKTYESSNLLCL